MGITLRQLEIFIAIAETKQVTKASKKLFLTQSAASMALAEMETQLGGPVFSRQGRTLILNDRGRFLLPHAQEILGKVSDVEALLSDADEAIVGELYVGASSTIGNYVLPYIIGAFMEMYRNVNINLQVTNSEITEKLIKSGETDVGFIEGKTHLPDLKTIPWLKDELAIISSPKHHLAESDALDPADLVNTKWIMREKGSGTAEIFITKISEYVDNLNIMLELGHTEAIKKAVEAGIGTSCLSTLAVSRELEHGWLKRLEVKGLDMTRQMSIILNKKRVRTKLMEEFLSFCEVIGSCRTSGRMCVISPWNIQELLQQQDES
ncbi:MAG TPA: LysR family transcriptional regulator [Thermodesulfobacteriaceae bacterium]|nr:LysR family transcriptional regulator [Thermodesulfobacteriaceae bacterium]